MIFLKERNRLVQFFVSRFTNCKLKKNYEDKHDKTTSDNPVFFHDFVIQMPKRTSLKIFSQRKFKEFVTPFLKNLEQWNQKFIEW